MTEALKASGERDLRTKRRTARCVVKTALLASMVAATGALLAAPAARAVTPGANGKIAFVSDRDGNYEIYTMNADGTGTTRLTNDPADESLPSWSPDGKRIAFKSYRDDPSSPSVFTMNADGSGVTKLAYGNASTWSPDGKKIAYSRGDDGIWVMNADGSGQVHICSDTGYGPAWSPDGSKIAFASHRDGIGEIYVVNPDGSGPTRLTFDDAWDSEPSWSPNGSKLALTKGGAIYVMNADGTGQTMLPGSPSSDYSPAWSPDGSKIAFTTLRDANPAQGNLTAEIYTMNPDGTNQIRITTNTFEDGAADWQTVPSADLGAKVSPVGSAVEGQNLTYSIVVTNNGPSKADSVLITDALPQGTEFVSVNHSGCWVTPPDPTPNVKCKIGGLPPGWKYPLSVTVKVVTRAGSTITNTVSVVSSTPDPVPNNNVAKVSTVVGAVK